ncbi:MAG: DNA cytosine methyltransferase [bacterium]
MNKYVKSINSLKPRKKRKEIVLDLFAGAGGLALGFEANGFETIGLEFNIDCVNTYNNNLVGKCLQETITSKTKFPKADIVIGGPPCQPFSVGGKQKGSDDTRNGFPAFIEAIRQVEPKIFLFENVRGLLYKNRPYFDEVVSQLQNMGYYIEFQLFNTSFYGVPQKRERLVVIGIKSGNYTFPNRLQEIVTAGDAVGDLINNEVPESKYLTQSMEGYVGRYEKASKCIRPRDLHLDQPARTLTCRNLAGATGDMHRVILENGRRRRLTTKEAARLQSFPDWFRFKGSESSAFYQIGNAVPPLFAYHLASSFCEYLDSGIEVPEEKVKRCRHLYQSKLIEV